MNILVIQHIDAVGNNAVQTKGEIIKKNSFVNKKLENGLKIGN